VLRKHGLLIIVALTLGCAAPTVSVPSDAQSVLIHHPHASGGKVVDVDAQAWLLALLEGCEWSSPLHTPPASELAIEFLRPSGESAYFHVHGSDIYASADSGYAACRVTSSQAIKLSKLSD